MDFWIGVHNTHMANTIVKWWRTKFLNGYKQFAVECGNGKVSDTEELLAKIDSEDESFDRLRMTCTPPLREESNQSPVTPDVPSSPKQKSQPVHHRLNLEEFSCDVSVDNTTKKCGQDRQEFSFTLYDFDGHGKITKDDIAGLVTTIYEALGSSVKVPHYGSKTIKVKLTVSPEQRKQMGGSDRTHDDTRSQNSNDSSKVRYKKDFNVTIKDSKEKRQRCKTRVSKKPETLHKCCQKQNDEPEENDHHSDDYTDICSRVSEAASTDCEEDDRCSDNDGVDKKKQKKFYKGGNKRYTVPNLFLRDLYNHQENCIKTKKTKKRSGSLQRQELLEIIQANMEKNLSFQTSGKQCSHHVQPESKLQAAQEKKQKRQYYKSTKDDSFVQTLAEMVNPTHFYVDLASLQNTTAVPQDTCDYSKLVDAVMCVSNKRNTLNKQSKFRKCTKAKADMIKCHLRDYSFANDENFGKTYKRPKKANFESTRRYMKKNPQVVTGHTSSPHYLKHRNRQEDQARSMAQVVRWLEQEFSSNLTTRDQNKTKYPEKEPHNKQGSAANSPKGCVERHEHHHIHKHIHHHYHHYQDIPIVV